MSKIIYIFDIDNTIAESGKQVSENMIRLLSKLKETRNCELAICGGGNFMKGLWQVNNSTLFDHMFSECGCVYNKCVDGKYELVIEKDIRKHPLINEINILIKHCMKFIANLDYNLGGHMIDVRKGIIYVSLIGMTALDSEREMFIELDEKYHYREILVNELNNIIKTLKCDDKIKAMIGGAVGISIMPSEYDKSQIIKYLDGYSEIHYFGDKYKEGGNDFEIMQHSSIIAHPVDNTEQTEEILQNLIFK